MHASECLYQINLSGFQDDRLAGGYENVPTVDIHTNQIGWEQHWLYILRTYIAPLANKIFTGYYSEVCTSLLTRYSVGTIMRCVLHAIKTLDT